jgi:CheY-like chemotaxis protein
MWPKVACNGLERFFRAARAILAGFVALKHTSLSSTRLWSEVQGGRLFVPTTTTLAVGERLSLDVEAPGLVVPLTLNGVVVQVQALSGRAPAGLYVTIDAADVQRCRLAMGLERDEKARAAGRSEPRVECDLEARVLQPVVLAGCRARSLSASGLTLKTPTPVAQGTQLGLSLALPDGEVLLRADVMWSRPELSLAGLHLIDLAPEVARRLATLVEKLGARAVPPPADVAAAGAPVQTVLVADDDPSILDFSTKVITKSGYRALRAERGDTALELARSERPALLLLDVLMPGLDGLEVCRAVRADATLKDTPVVLLSAMGEQRLAEAAAQVGATAWMTKPMRLDALRDLFNRLIPKG